MSKNSFIFLTILSCGILVSLIALNSSFIFLEFSTAAGQEQQQQIPSSSPSASSSLPSAQQTEKQIQEQKSTWTISSGKLNIPRSEITSAILDDGKIYVIGGLNATGKNINNWTSQPPMPTARHGLAAETIGDKIYVIAGGIKPGLSVSDLNEIFQIIGH